MGLFKKNKKTDQKKEEIKSVLKKYKDFTSPPEMEIKPEEIISREYREFKEEEVLVKKPATWYEKACSYSEKIIKISPGKETKTKLEKSIEFTGLRASPEGIIAFALISFILTLLLAIVIALIPNTVIPIPTPFKLLFFLFAPLTAYYLFYYPMSKAAVLRVQVGGDLVIGILYMIVYMKSTPNLEGAVRFAAMNTTGKLANDLREILWRVEIGEYKTIDSALTDYMLKWEAFNKEFVEALGFIKGSMLERNPARREILLNNAINTILVGTDEKMKAYSRDLRMPIMVLHGMGILLPVLGMIIFPLISIFLEFKDLSLYLIIGYNILLPLTVYILIKSILDKRPATHMKIDISEHPDAISLTEMKILGKILPVWPVALISGLLIISIGLALNVNYAGVETTTASPLFLRALASELFQSIFFILGVATALVIYFRGTSFQKVGIRCSISTIEKEFENALFALGNRLSSGIPLEVALRNAEEDTRELKISGLFRLILKNIEGLNMTFKQALFDKEYGALLYYPSRLVKTIMQSIAESTKKGTEAASTAMLTISKYLNSIHTTQEKIEDLLSEIVSSMKFQAYILVPAISGVVVATAYVIMSMMLALQKSFASLSEDAMPDIVNLQTATPPWMLQLIVGFYVIELLVLLSVFINRIETGEDRISENDLIWRVLLFGTIMYIAVLATVGGVFGLFINPLLGALGA